MNGAPYRCAGHSGCAAPGEGWAGFQLFKALVTALLGQQTPSGLLVQLDHPRPGCKETWLCPDPCAKITIQFSSVQSLSRVRLFVTT